MTPQQIYINVLNRLLEMELDYCGNNFLFRKDFEQAVSEWETKITNHVVLSHAQKTDALGALKNVTETVRRLRSWN